MKALFDAQRYSLPDVGRRLNVHSATVWRWALRGVRGRKLRTILVGGRRYVLREDLERFLAPNEHSPDFVTRAEVASKLLDAHGFGKS